MHRIILSFALMTGLLLGQPTSSKYDKEFMRLTKVVKDTQHKFHMDNISLGLKLVSRKELKETMKMEACGASFYDTTAQLPMGVIWVLRSDKYPKDKTAHCGVSDIKTDQRNTVVHEMVHFLMNFSPTEEQAVTLIANTIVPVKPLKPPKKKK